MVNLEQTTPSPVGPRGDPGDGARVPTVTAGPSSPATRGDERRHAHPLGHRARRPPRRREAPAPGLRGTPHARRTQARRREARPDPPGDGPRARGVPPPRPPRRPPALERPRPLL